MLHESVRELVAGGRVKGDDGEIGAASQGKGGAKPKDAERGRGDSVRICRERSIDVICTIRRLKKTKKKNKKETSVGVGACS